MPYIDKKRRQQIELHDPSTITNAGELNYAITILIKGYLETKGESYQTYNDILGVLSAIPKELYDRKIRQYEDLKMEENGDVWHGV